MKENVSAKSLSGFVIDPLERSRAGLGKPADGRWAWFLRRRRITRIVAQLQQTRPVTVTRYQTASQGVGLLRKKLRRTRRWQIATLWSRIIWASLFAVLRRYWWVLAILLSLGALVALVIYSLPYLQSLLPPPVDPAASPDGPTGPQNPNAPVVDPAVQP